MITTLYPTFQKWSEKGSVYIVSDTHFDDDDCKIMDPTWITPKEHIEIIKKKCHKNDTLIHLGDVGNPIYFKDIKAHKVLIMGNHDESASKFKDYFDEIYTGPLIIAEKLILSHEPVDIEWLFNIHGHDHNKKNKGDSHHLNLASNVVNFKLYTLKEIIGKGVMKNVKSLHRCTIDLATSNKEKRGNRNG